MFVTEMFYESTYNGTVEVDDNNLSIKVEKSSPSSTVLHLFISLLVSLTVDIVLVLGIVAVCRSRHSRIRSKMKDRVEETRDRVSDVKSGEEVLQLSHAQVNVAEVFDKATYTTATVISNSVSKTMELTGANTKVFQKGDNLHTFC